MSTRATAAVLPERFPSPVPVPLDFAVQFFKMPKPL